MLMLHWLWPLKQGLSQFCLEMLELEGLTVTDVSPERLLESLRVTQHACS